MPQIRKEGKDTIIFTTKEDDATPSKLQLPEPEPSPGLLLPTGEINWGCPCLGGMATGPCGLEFREAFSCFHFSTEEPKGSNCYDAFKTMQACMVQYPSLYANKNTDLDDLEDEDEISHKKVQHGGEGRRDVKSDDKVSEVKNESDQNVASSGKEVTSAKA